MMLCIYVILFVAWLYCLAIGILKKQMPKIVSSIQQQ